MKPLIHPLAMAAVLLGLAVAAIVPAPAAAQEDPVLYVVADVVKLREWPTRDDVVVANLRIGTPVRLLDGGRAPEGWTKVAIAPGGGADYDITGYVASAFLSEERPTAGALLDRYQAQMAAGDLAAARSSAQRLLALDPANADHAERLRMLYERLGYEDGVARLTAHLQGDGVKYLGYCGTGGSAILLAEYRPADEYDPQPHLGQPLDNRLTRYEELGFAQTLQRMPWFGLDPAGNRDSHLMQGAWIMDSGFLRRSAAEVNWRMGRSAECVPGTVYSNEPLRAVESGPFDPDTAGDMIEAMSEGTSSNAQPFTFHAVRGRQIFDDPGLTSVLFQLDKTQQGYLGAGEEGFFWGLFDGDDDLLTYVGTFYPGYGYALISRVTWAAWPSSSVRVVILEGSSYEDKGAGMYDTVLLAFVVEEEGGQVRLQRIR